MGTSKNNNPEKFYNDFTCYYHLIYDNWEESITRQAQHLDSIIKVYLNEEKREILDISCGIGTQSLGLAALGYNVTASDISENEINRAREEAENYVFRY